MCINAYSCFNIISCWFAQSREKCIHSNIYFRLYVGWEQPNWFALPSDVSGYKPSFRRTNWFEPVRREVKAVLTRVGVIDLTPFGKMEVSGADACKFIDHVFANVVPEVNRKRYERTVYTAQHKRVLNSGGRGKAGRTDRDNKKRRRLSKINETKVE